MDALVASKPPHLLHLREIFGSSLLHVGMLSAAIMAGRASTPMNVKPVVDTTMVFLPRLAAPPVNRPVARPPGALRGNGGGNGQIIIAANPPPRGFQVIQVVTAVPTEIPPVSAMNQILDPRDFTGRGAEGGTGWGVAGGTGPADQVELDTGTRDLLYEAGVADQRFRPAELVVRPRFVHPRMLLEAGIPGRVVLRFIIDTAGQVEPGSIEVMEQTHEAYAASACRGVLGARFRPAHFGARVVRQLTRWPVNFEVTTSGAARDSGR